MSLTNAEFGFRKFSEDDCLFLHNLQGGCGFILWENEVVKMTKEVINETSCVEKNEGVLQERR